MKKRRNPAGDLFGVPESVQEQKARLARESDAAKRKEAFERLKEQASKKLVGSRGSIGQRDMFGGGDLFSNPMKLIRGSRLNATQRAQVLKWAKVRHTRENWPNVGRPGAKMPALQTDAQWLGERAFYIKPRGSVDLSRGAVIVHPGEFENPMKRRKRYLKNRASASAPSPKRRKRKVAKAAGKTIRTDVKSTTIVRKNPRKRRKARKIARRAVTRKAPAMRKRHVRRAKRHTARKTSKCSYLAIRQGGKILLSRVQNSTVKRLGSFSTDGLKKYCAKRGIKMR